VHEQATDGAATPKPGLRTTIGSGRDMKEAVKELRWRIVSRKQDYLTLIGAD